MRRDVAVPRCRQALLLAAQVARFPEFAVSGETMLWSRRLRAVMELLQRHIDRGEIDIEDGELELAAEHFLALVEALPSRLAEFGVFRSDRQAERHLQYAVKLFLRAVAPTHPIAESGNMPAIDSPAGQHNRPSRTTAVG